MKGKYLIKRLIAVVLVFSLVLLSACSNTPTNNTLSDPNSSVLVEDVQEEQVITEEIIFEHLTSETYLGEITIAEERITELLLNEDEISEVILCKTIYVPQDGIEEFSKNSQTTALFGGNIDIAPLLTKVSVGTGVIITLVVLKKVGLQDQIASIVVSAADKSLSFAKNGAMIGSLFGGMTGVTDTVDDTGRTSAVMGFALAAVGLIVSIVSLVGAIPSGGSTTISAAAGVKLVIAGITVLAATAGTAVSGYNTVKTFTSTDATDIDWKNIDWKKAGVESAQKAINYGAEGYMWGSIIGAVYGGAEGYEFYEKYNTPYSKYNARLMQTPKDGSGGHWTGDRGESEFVLDEPIELPDGTKVKSVAYKNAVPDFSPFQRAQVKIPRMNNNRSSNFSQADEALANYWTRIRHNNQKWKAADVKAYRENNGLTWHEMNNMESMQLVPSEVNQRFGHLGGVGEYNAAIGEEGVGDFD